MLSYRSRKGEAGVTDSAVLWEARGRQPGPASITPIFYSFYFYKISVVARVGAIDSSWLLPVSGHHSCLWALEFLANLS